MLNLNARRINRLRPGGGLDTHAAVTRFLGIPSDILGERLPDTAFTQYGGLLRTNFNLNDTTQLLFSYARNQQDGGRRYDQLAGGDGNLIADLRNLMTDLFYARLVKQNLGFFDNAQFTFSYNGQREERVNQGGQGNPLAAITNQRERTNVLGFNFHLDKQIGDLNTFTLGADVYRDKITAPAFTTDPVTGVSHPLPPAHPRRRALSLLRLLRAGRVHGHPRPPARERRAALQRRVLQIRGGERPSRRERTPVVP